MDVARFWLGLGFDGLRLDAIPYLVERDGTDCDNLPETHAVIRAIRSMVDQEFPDAMLLAEANQMPREVVEYFGNGDECHMCYHFPVMPRLYMSLRRGETSTLVSTLRDTPEIPPGAQWAIFLRNHDELTLEMVTPEEREWMWAEYAPDPRMRLNLGIRRRLAPLLDGDRRKIELLAGLLLSLPGSPFLYYGDEIGMGDNIWLHDRDGVRTPMQWENGPGAGFSNAAPELLHLPLIDAPGYSPADVNVADQRGDPHSLLEWTRGMLAIRRRHPAFGKGDFTIVDVADPALFVFERSGEGRALLVAANFSDDERPVAGLAGRATDAIAGTERDLARLTLGPFGFAWLLRQN